MHRGLPPRYRRSFFAGRSLLVRQSLQSQHPYTLTQHPTLPSNPIASLQGISVYRSLIVDDNGTLCRYDDPRKLSDNYFSIELPQNEIENLRRDGYIIIKKY
jgi:hypothetical protein